MATETPAPPVEAPKPEAALVKQRIPVNFDPNNPIALYMDTGIFEQLQRVATLLSKASFAPPHLRDKPADCFLVVAQAFRWGMDPFSVAQHTFVTSGKLGYEGKLIAALINASGNLDGKLDYEYSGPVGTPGRTVTVKGKLRGEQGKVREVTGSVSGWKTQNVKWVEMPDQMLSYRGAREWARRHMPEAVLGIQADEEVEEQEPRVVGEGRTTALPPGTKKIDALTDALTQPPAPAAAAVTSDPDPTPVQDEPGAAEGAAVLTDEMPPADPYCSKHGPLVTVVSYDKVTGKAFFSCGGDGKKKCPWSAER